MCRLSGGKIECAYRDYGILRRGVPFGVILERSEGSRRGHLSLRMTVLGVKAMLEVHLQR